MRGPLLSGPLGSASAPDAIMRWLGDDATVVVVGPLWMGTVLATPRCACPVCSWPVALTRIAQERPRDGTVLTTGAALAPVVRRAELA